MSKPINYNAVHPELAPKETGSIPEPRLTAKERRERAFYGLEKRCEEAKTIYYTACDQMRLAEERERKLRENRRELNGLRKRAERIGLDIIKPFKAKKYYIATSGGDFISEAGIMRADLDTVLTELEKQKAAKCDTITKL